MNFVDFVNFVIMIFFPFLQAMEKKVREEVDKDAEQCLNDAEPALESVYEHVHHRLLPGFKVRGCDLFTWGTPKV